LDLNLPALIKTIYSADGKWRKTGFYPPASNVANGKVVPNLFSLLDPVEHVRQKRPVSKHYSLAGVLQLESHFDDAIRLLCHQLEERFMTRDGDFGQGFDLGQWIKMCLFPGISNPSMRADCCLLDAWDVIGQITFSKRFGYLDKGRDFDGHLWLSEMGSDYLASVSQVPYLDRWIDKNPVFPIGGATVLLGPTLRYVGDRHHGRDGDTHDDTKPDFLDKFIEAKTEHPDVVDDTQIISYLAINMLAGADTTAISIKAVFYYVLRTPHAQQRLEEEIMASDFVRQQAIPPAYDEIKGLSYLEAVVREAMRLHPGVAMTLPRYVPPGEGLVLPDGSVVPPGTSVGMNPYVVGRNKAVWGPNADEFCPERWLRGAEELQEAYAERLQAMNSADLTFGAGSRVCLGRHFGLVEVYKVVTSLFALYEMEAIDPTKEWWVRNGFFLRQKGPEVRMRPRQRRQ
jgi:hypothetical protein